MKIVIIGASAAGISAAKTIKASEPDTEVVIISKEGSVHSRCMLHKFLGHQRDAKGISFIADDFFASTGITWLNNTTVISLDAQKKTVKTHDNQDISGGDEFTAGSKLAQAYQQLFEEQGAEFILNDKVVSVDVDEVGRGKTIHLASGKAVPAERTECCD